MKDTEAIARYAKALLESARDRGALEDMTRDMRKLCSLVSECPELGRFLPLLTSIGKTFEKLVEQHGSCLHVVIRSANPLDSGMVALIENRLRERYRQPVESVVKIDPSLVGGVRIHVGDRVHDFSLAGQLLRLRRALSVA